MLASITCTFVASNVVIHVHVVHVVIFHFQVTCLQFCDDQIVSGSDDTTLKIWSAITGEVRYITTS